MFPYPSGDLHLGHAEAFSGGDAIARFRWLQGYNVADKRLPSPSLFGLGYYVATLAAIKGLEAAGGDLSNGQAKFKEALNKLQLDSPIGKITLNENRQATGTVFVNEVVDGPDGNLTSKMVAKTENVNQTLGMTTAQFRALGLPSRDVVDCAKLRAGG